MQSLSAAPRGVRSLMCNIDADIAALLVAKEKHHEGQCIRQRSPRQSVGDQPVGQADPNAAQGFWSGEWQLYPQANPRPFPVGHEVQAKRPVGLAFGEPCAAV
ncbi:hypothetical protein PP339_gp012 [Mycobacterium phage Onyinye]|uniref:Uncharacterized protein n=1 Tax=Mycobacterium phage Onyinye TaxID=2686235 RepID=A0A6B9L9L2_9CAUD|nr:hypothetical protein PP339_gp012 [Mycobacterium phage Onyinye]QHB37513.1 hypothetical protein SEA_ONYINYE_12 [Mycobacterium phage Onyinye]